MRRQSDIEVISQVGSRFSFSTRLCNCPGGGDALPGFQDGETVTFTQNIDKAGPAAKSGLKREG